MKTVFSFPVIFSILFSEQVIANNEFDYFGFSFQHNSYDKVNFVPNIDTTTFEPLQYNADDSALGFRGFLGHQFNRFLAVEAGIISFGKASFSVFTRETDSNGKSIDTIVHKGAFKTLAGDFRINATYPLSDTLFLKGFVGASFWDNEYEILHEKDNKLSVKTNSDTGVSLLTGVGIGYSISRSFAFSLDFQRIKIAELNSQSIDLSLLFQF